MSRQILRGIISFIFFVAIAVNGSGQQPTHYPSGDDPVQFTFVNILIYIVTPFLLLAFYLYWRISKKKKEKEKEERNRD